MQNGPSQGPRETTLPTAHEIIERTPLHDAAAAGDDQLVEKILKNGADRNHKESKHGNTALHEAAWLGYSRCVKALCALPVRPDIAGAQQPAAASKHVKQAIAQTQGSLHSALLGTRNQLGFSPLHLAAQNGHNQSCREILLAGGDANVQNNYGDTPLHTACRYGHAGATRILLSGNADPQRVNLNGDSALHIACAMGRRKLTRILLSAGSSQRTKNAQQETARDICERKKLTEILEILASPPSPVNYGSGGVDQTDDVGRDRSLSDTRRPKESKTRRLEKDSKRQRTPTESPAAQAAAGGEHLPANPKNWSPYGCHYFPDPKSFPSPKLKTLPKEPLATGEQYYLDLAGNIRKGPVGVGNTCYCGPFFRHIEERISENRKSIKKFVHRATEKIDSKVQALASKTDDQIEQIQRSMLADRRHCDGQRQHLERWLKRGERGRATVAAHTSKSRKDETNTNTLTRCRSLELLDGGAAGVEACYAADDQHQRSSLQTTAGLSRSFGLLNTISLRADVHAEFRGAGGGETSEDAGGDPVDDEDENAGGVDRTVHRLYYLDSDKEWQYNGSSDKERLSSARSGRQRSSASRLTGGSDSERRADISVAARLEELLSKTNEIIEMERSARRKSQYDDEQLLAPGLQVRKSSKYSDRLRGRTTSRSSGGGGGGGGSHGAGDYESDSLVNRSQRTRRRSAMPFGSGNNSTADDSSFQIAQEMERITASLLGTSGGRERDRDRDRDRHHQQHSSASAAGAGAGGASGAESGSIAKASPSSDHHQHHHQGPVSPEIAKEYHSRKEQRAALEKEQESSSLISDGSQRSIYMPAFASQEARDMLRLRQQQQLERTANGYRSSSSQSRRSAAFGGSADPAATAASGFGTFYQNVCFDEEEPADDDQGPDETDNGQTSRRAAQTTLKSYGMIGGASDAGSVMDADEHCELSEMANIRQLNELKSRILNGAHWMRPASGGQQQQQQQQHQQQQHNVAENAIIGGPEVEAQEEDVAGAGVSNLGKVRELVAMIQGSKNFEKAYALECEAGETEENDDEDDDVDSESSDDDEDDDENVEDEENQEEYADKVETSKHEAQLNNGLYTNQSNYMEYSHEIDTHQHPDYEVHPTVASRPKPYVDLPEASTVLGEPIASSVDAPPPIRFSSYPHQPTVPVLDTRYLIPKDAYFHELPNRPRPKAITPTSGDYGLNDGVGGGVVAMGAALLPPPTSTSVAYAPHLSLGEPPQSMLVSTQPIYYQSHQMPVAPQREKLLSNRKFSALPVGVPVAHMLGAMSLGAPMPAVRSSMQHQQHIPDTTASNDSGYSARISQTAASPSLSGQSLVMGDSPELLAEGGYVATRRHTAAAVVEAAAAAAAPVNGYEPYFLGNIGASSLV